MSAPPSDPSDVDRVAAALVGLKKTLDSSGLVLDPELRTRITRAHADSGMPDDAVVYVVLAPPVSSENLEALAAACRDGFGIDLPADYRAFLERHDGLTIGELDAEQAQQLAQDPQAFGEEAIMSSVLVLDWLAAHRTDVTHPYGAREIIRPQVLPFYVIAPEVGFHAFDLSGHRTPPLGVVDVDADRLWQPSGHPGLAPSFALWLEGFVAAGCEAFGVRAALAQLAERDAAPLAAPEPEKSRSAPLAAPEPEKSRSAPLAAAIAAPALGPSDAMFPLVVRRSTTGIILLTLSMVTSVGYLVSAGRWDPGMAIRGLIALGLLAYCVKRVLASRHAIEIDDAGILDSTLQKARIPWSAIDDITCETTRNGGTLVLSLKRPADGGTLALSLKRPADETVRIDLDGVRMPIQTIVSSAIAYLQAAKEKDAVKG